MPTTVRCRHSHGLSCQAFLLKVVGAPAPLDLGGRLVRLEEECAQLNSRHKCSRLNSCSISWKLWKESSPGDQKPGQFIITDLCGLLSLPSLPLALSQVTRGKMACTLQPQHSSWQCQEMESCLHPALQHPTQTEGLRPWRQPRPGFQDSCPWELGWREGKQVLSEPPESSSTTDSLSKDRVTQPGLGKE